GKRLRHLDRKAVEIEIILVAVGSEPLPRRIGSASAHGDELQADHIALAIADIAQEIGDAEPAFLVLPRQRKARDLAPAVIAEEHDVIAIAGGMPVAVAGLRPQDILALD